MWVYPQVVKPSHFQGGAIFRKLRRRPLELLAGWGYPPEPLYVYVNKHLDVCQISYV
jgi:hypothetical protein